MVSLVFAVVGLLVWAGGSDQGQGQSLGLAGVVHVCAQWWMLAHGVELPTWAGQAVQIVPLGIPLAVGGLMVVALMSGLRPVASGVVGSPRLLGCLLAGTSAGYLAVSASIAALGGRGVGAWVHTVMVSVVIATLSTTLACGWVALRQRLGSATGWLRRLLAVSVGAAGAVATLLAGGMGLVTLSLALHGEQVQASAQTARSGVLSGVLFSLVQLAYLPTLGVWAAALSTGPGFALGLGTRAHPWSSTITDVPLVPILEAAPRAMPWWGVGLMALPVLAGAVAAWLTRRAYPAARRPSLYALAAAALAGVGLAALCLPASGALASGYYATVGPVWWQVGLAAAAQMSLAAVVTSGWLHRKRFIRGRHQPA